MRPCGTVGIAMMSTPEIQISTTYVVATSRGDTSRVATCIIIVQPVMYRDYNRSERYIAMSGCFTDTYHDLDSLARVCVE